MLMNVYDIVKQRKEKALLLPGKPFTNSMTLSVKLESQ